MAEVYQAKDTRLGRDVAIKVVSEALGSDGAFLERFEREAKLGGSLNHPNVVALYDVGFQDGKPYFVTELLEGDSMRKRLATGPIPLARALEWAAQMAQGLAAAHERSIVHRDLKPENVFITRDGQVKLLDFGIAKLVEAAQASTPHSLMDETVSPSGSSTGTGMVLGTPGYMSPEQVRATRWTQGLTSSASVRFSTRCCVVIGRFRETKSSRAGTPSFTTSPSRYRRPFRDPSPGLCIVV
jgi:eukaryotic-like serine/threonine-protein kinase